MGVRETGLVLLRFDRFDGALVDAGAAVGALLRIDHPLAVLLGYCLYRTDRVAGAAVDAVIAYLVCHLVPPLLGSWARLYYYKRSDAIYIFADPGGWHKAC